MAGWQFDGYIIPSDRKDSDRFDEDRFLSWIDRDVDPSSLDILRSFLPEESGWSAEILQFGKIDSTCVEVIFTEGRVSEIVLRLDLRSVSRNQLADIVKYIIIIDGNIYHDGMIIPPEIECLITAMKKSSAARFCADPLSYLRKIESSDSNRLDRETCSQTDPTAIDVER